MGPALANPLVGEDLRHGRGRDLSSDQLSIETPELVAIEMPLAGIGSRFIALLVDYLIWGAGLLVLCWFSPSFLPGICGLLNNLSAMG